MRVSDVTKHKTVRSNMNASANELQKLLGGMSSGKKLVKPSDDPVGAAMVQDYQTSINRSETIQKNIGADKVWLNSTEAALDKISETIMHTKELALEGANGANTKEHRMALAEEVRLIAEQLVKIGNKKEGKLHLFSGTKTLTPPLQINSRVQEAEVIYAGTRIKAQTTIPPIDQDKPLGLAPGPFTLSFQAQVPEGQEVPPPVQMVLELTGAESLKQLVETINQAAQAETNWEEDPNSPTGFKQKIYASIGVDNSLYLDLVPGYKLSLTALDDNPNSLRNKLALGVVGDPAQVAADIPVISDASALDVDYEPTFKGFSQTNYLVKVIKGGTFGQARYVVSDDDGVTWSQPQSLEKQNEIYNPDGKASDKVKLNFGIGGKPYFREGTEFHFEGNEFVEYQGNDQIKEVMVDNGIKVALNITAEQVFSRDPEDAATVDVFEVYNRLSEALEDDDQEVVAKSLDELNRAIDQVLKRRAQVGATVLEMESSEARVAQEVDFKAAELSEIQDLDIAEASVDLNSAEMKHKVALDASARLVQPTLINFLK